MGAAELRQELHDYIEQADMDFLRRVHAMSKEYEKPEIAGFTPDGTPIYSNELVKRVKAASKRVKAGDFATQEEVDKEVENW